MLHALENVLFIVIVVVAYVLGAIYICRGIKHLNTRK